MQDKIRESLKEAMIAKDSFRMTVMRGILSGFTNELVAKGKKPTEQLTDEEAIAVMRRALKQRKESALSFRNGGREDLAEKEDKEGQIIESFLPKMMSVEEVESKVSDIISKLQIDKSDKSASGKIMGEVMRELKGLADGGDVKNAVSKILS